MDHGGMNHGGMDHGGMDHGGMDMVEGCTARRTSLPSKATMTESADEDALEHRYHLDLRPTSLLPYPLPSNPLPQSRPHLPSRTRLRTFKALRCDVR